MKIDDAGIVDNEPICDVCGRPLKGHVFYEPCETPKRAEWSVEFDTKIDEWVGFFDDDHELIRIKTPEIKSFIQREIDAAVLEERGRIIKAAGLWFDSYQDKQMTFNTEEFIKFLHEEK